MGYIEEYKIDNVKPRAMMVACDYVGSYQTANNEDIKIARKKFFKNIVQIAKNKSHNTVMFSFISSDTIEKEQINKVTEILKDEELKNIMEESNVKVLLGGQYRKKNSENKYKYEDIIDELEDLSYQYNVTDVLALEDTTNSASKIFFINEKIYDKFPNINIDYISLTNSFAYYQKYKENGWKFNMYGEFLDEEYKKINDGKVKQSNGLGKYGYISNGLSQIIEKQNIKKKAMNKKI